MKNPSTASGYSRAHSSHPSSFVNLINTAQCGLWLILLGSFLGCSVTAATTADRNFVLIL